MVKRRTEISLDDALQDIYLESSLKPDRKRKKKPVLKKVPLPGGPSRIHDKLQTDPPPLPMPSFDNEIPSDTIWEELGSERLPVRGKVVICTSLYITYSVVILFIRIKTIL